MPRPTRLQVLAGVGERQAVQLPLGSGPGELHRGVHAHDAAAEADDDVTDVLYKGALQGASARSVWIGDVLIGPDATGTDSYEANRNLVLTDGARADCEEAEDHEAPGLVLGDAAGLQVEQLLVVEPAGGAGVAGAPDVAGLDLEVRDRIGARAVGVLGFLTEIVQKIDIPALQDELIAAIEAELALTESAVEASA
jgi:Fe-S cluster assembly protein SufD